MGLLPPGAFVVDDHFQETDANLVIRRAGLGWRRNGFGSQRFGRATTHGLHGRAGLGCESGK
jgi:hypothetical protein